MLYDGFHGCAPRTSAIWKFNSSIRVIRAICGLNHMEKAMADLKEALRERVAIIQDEQSRRDEAKHIARLKAISERIDTIHATLPQPVDPRLAHYLQRRSYEKALE